MRFLFILILPAILFSYDWTQPQLVADVGGHCHHCRFGLDCFDSLWCIFTVSADPCTVKASCYTEAQWSEPISIYGGIQANAVGGFDVTRAKNGKLWVLICEEDLPGSPPHITFYYDGSAWSDTFIIPPPGGVTYWHLAADSSGKVWATFDDNEDPRIWCDVCEDTIWSGPYVVCDYPGGNLPTSCITVDPNGTRWVCGGPGSQGEQIFLTYSDSTGAWTGNLIMGPEGGTRAIVSDNEGNIWVAFFNEAERRIYTIYLDTNLNWSPSYQITQSSGEFHGLAKMAVDGENKVWIVYDKDSTFYYRVWDGFEWSPEEAIVAPPASAAYHGDVFYDSVRNRIWILYLDGYPIGDIYATWTNPSSGVEEEKESTSQNLLITPNPATRDLLFQYTIPQKAKIDLNLYDNSGRLVRRIFTGEKLTGTYSEKISLNNYPNGVYHLLLKTSNAIIKRKLVLIK